MLGCTDDNNRAVMCMQRGIVLRDTCSTVFHCRNSLYVVSCGCVSFYYLKFSAVLSPHGVAFL
jgi:hypothetical protein